MKKILKNASERMAACGKTRPGNDAAEVKLMATLLELIRFVSSVIILAVIVAALANFLRWLL